jgi:hypothetical protein
MGDELSSFKLLYDSVRRKFFMRVKYSFQAINAAFLNILREETVQKFGNDLNKSKFYSGKKLRAD